MSNMDNYVKSLGLSEVKFKIGIDKVSSDGMTRYMHVYLGEHDVTGIVAHDCGYRLSTARNSYNSIIVRGCGMDMGFAVAYNIKSHSSMPEIYSEYYDYLGLKKRGKYEYA